MTIMSRRTLLKGVAGVTVLAAGGLVWRAWDNGVFHVGEGPAYEPWHDWRDGDTEGELGIVRAGILASNAHNTQPWRFHVTKDRITVFADHDRNLGAFDPHRREMALSLGCAIENMVIAARAQGFAAQVAYAPARFHVGGPDAPAAPVAAIQLTPAPADRTLLFQAIAHRHTHRGAYEPAQPISNALQQEMHALIDDRETIGLFFFDSGVTKQRLGEIIIAATEDIIADYQMAMDSAEWFRFDWRSIQKHRDGVTLDTFGLPRLLNAAAKIIPAPSPEQADRQWLDATRDVHVPTAPLLGLIAVKDLYDQPTTLRAGRLWQRLHLWATDRGLAAQPLNMPAERVDRELELGQEPRMAAALAEVTGDPAWRPTFVFRMGYADWPARLSPRRAVESVLVA